VGRRRRGQLRPSRCAHAAAKSPGGLATRAQAMRGVIVMRVDRLFAEKRIDPGIE